MNCVPLINAAETPLGPSLVTTILDCRKCSTTAPIRKDLPQPAAPTSASSSCASLVCKPLFKYSDARFCDVVIWWYSHQEVHGVEVASNLIHHHLTTGLSLL